MEHHNYTTTSTEPAQNNSAAPDPNLRIVRIDSPSPPTSPTTSSASNSNAVTYGHNSNARIAGYLPPGGRIIHRTVAMLPPGQQIIGTKMRITNGAQTTTTATGQRLLLLNSAIRHPSDRMYYAASGQQIITNRSISAVPPPSAAVSRGIRGRPTYMPAGMRTMSHLSGSTVNLVTSPGGTNAVIGSPDRRIIQQHPVSAPAAWDWPHPNHSQRGTLTVRSQKVVQQTQVINGKLQQQQQAQQTTRHHIAVPRGTGNASVVMPPPAHGPIMRMVTPRMTPRPPGIGMPPSTGNLPINSPPHIRVPTPGTAAVRIVTNTAAPAVKEGGKPKKPRASAGGGTAKPKKQPAGRRLSYEDVPEGSEAPVKPPPVKRQRKTPAKKKEKAPPIPSSSSARTSPNLFLSLGNRSASSTQKATPPPKQVVPKVTAQDWLASKAPTEPESIAERHSRLSKTMAELRDRIRRNERSQFQRYSTEEIRSILKQMKKETLELNHRGDGTKEVTKADEKAATRRKTLELERKIDELLKSKVFRFKEEQLNNKTPVELARLIRRFEQRGGLLDSLSIGAARSVLQSDGQSPVTLTEETLDRLLVGSHRLLTLQRLIDTRRDPFATDSESDADDDFDGPGTSYSSKQRESEEHNPITKSSASWRWYSERAEIVNRYSFLQSRIEDVDYKIRQQIDILSQLTACKEAYRFEGDCGALKPEPPGTMDECAELSSARTRPLILPAPKRWIVRTTGTHQWNNDTMRIRSLGHCNCAPPYQPCLLCTGRTDNIREPGDINLDTTVGKYALIEPSIHPNLSSSTAISYERRLETYLQRLATRPKALVPRRRQSSAAYRGALIGPAEIFVPQKNKSASVKKKASTTATASAGTSKKKLKLLGKSTNTASKVSVNRKRKIPVRSEDEEEDEVEHLDTDDEDDDDWMFQTANRRRLDSSGSEDGGVRSKPLKLKLPAGKRSASTSMPRDRLFSDATDKNKRRGSTAGKLTGARRSTMTSSHTTYDFDNIVIDPSVLAVREIEKLEYKEIAVPGWRNVPLKPLSPPTNGLSSNEPIIVKSSSAECSEEEWPTSHALGQRHLQYEENEKLKFKEYKSIQAASARNNQPRISPSDSSTAIASSLATPMQFESPTKGGTVIPDYDRPSVVKPYAPRKFDPDFRQKNPTDSTALPLKAEIGSKLESIEDATPPTRKRSVVLPDAMPSTSSH